MDSWMGKGRGWEGEVTGREGGGIVRGGMENKDVKV